VEAATISPAPLAATPTITNIQIMKEVVKVVLRIFLDVMNVHMIMDKISALFVMKA
jgi:hypothetical protein